MRVVLIGASICGLELPVECSAHVVHFLLKLVRIRLPPRIDVGVEVVSSLVDVVRPKLIVLLELALLKLLSYLAARGVPQGSSHHNSLVGGCVAP